MSSQGGNHHLMNDGLVDCHLLKIKESLNTEDLSFENDDFELLQQRLTKCPQEFLDRDVFNSLLPLAYSRLHQIVENINEIVSKKTLNALDEVRKKLNTCHSLLNVWEKCVEHVKNLKNVSINSVRTLFGNLPETVKCIFHHCRHSKTSYDSCLFDGVTKELSNLFKKALGILRYFLDICENVTEFDPEIESEMPLIVKVIDLIGHISNISNYLDTKTFGEVTKFFVKWAIKYEIGVKKISSTNVVVHLKELALIGSEIVSSIPISLNNTDEAKVKKGCFVLKQLENLCSVYCSDLKNSLHSLIDCLVRSYRCSTPCLSILKNTDEKIIRLINTYISSFTEHLLNILFENDDFMEAYFEFGNHPNCFEYNMEYHLLTIDIMRKLIDLSYECSSHWLIGSKSILNTSITNIDNVQGEICSGELQVKGAITHDMEEKEQLVSIYDATLVPICVLISRIPPSEFYFVENLLLKFLLNGQLWSSLLSSDIWCFVARLGSPALCYNHLTYLLKVHKCLKTRRNSVETVLLSSLIVRLYKLLSPKMKHDLTRECVDFDMEYWLPIARVLPTDTRSFLHKKTTINSRVVSKTYQELCQQGQLKSWNDLEYQITSLGMIFHVQDADYLKTCEQIWSSIRKIIDNCEGKSLNTVSDLIITLLNGVRLSDFQSEVFSSILGSMIPTLMSAPSYVKIRIAYYLQDNVILMNRCNSKLSNLITQLMCRLLEDEHPMVFQEALESFDHIIHMCKDDNFVKTLAATASKKGSIKECLTAYVSNIQYYELRGFANLSDYLKDFSKDSKNLLTHCCDDQEYDHSERDGKMLKLETTMNNSQEFKKRVDKVCEDLNYILERKSDLDRENLEKLRFAFLQIFSR